MSADLTPESQAEDWYPSLSIAERDRRWARVRDSMAKQGLDCLLIAGLESREQFQQYVTNDHSGGYAIFPAEGEPVFLAWTASRITSQLEAASRGEIPWVTDSRVGANSATVIKVLRERGFDRARIGVVGLGGLGSRQVEGWIPYRAWANVMASLPEANFVDVTGAFAELVLVKGEEELRIVRRAAAVGEMAADAMLQSTRPGVSEGEIAGVVMQILYREGAAGEYGYIILHSGPHNPSWGPPLWLVRPQRPRKVEAGDVVQGEIFASYGSLLETQVQMSIAVAPLDPTNAECARIARESYEIGLRVLRPGRTFAEVVEDMARPLNVAGAWNLTPLIHSLGPMVAVAGRGVGLDKLPGTERYKGVQSLSIAKPTTDLVIQPNMVFELEPNACLGKHRINIGGTVIVTEDGVEELNKVSAEMRVV
ncbi:MAG: aminopeptidase P family protein [Chloroflexi bacterium]|nr:aminopeptidase P family protein [Chloroflexota bacterium]